MTAYRVHTGIIHVFSWLLRSQVHRCVLLPGLAEMGTGHVTHRLTPMERLGLDRPEQTTLPAAPDLCSFMGAGP